MNKEDQLQMACADYLRLQYPRVLWCHIANERQTSPARGAKLKRMGVRKGMPDILVFKKISTSKPPFSEVRWMNPMNCGLAIELKIKPNKPSIHQMEVLNQLSEEGWISEVCYDFDAFKEIVDKYLG